MLRSIVRFVKREYGEDRFLAAVERVIAYIDGFNLYFGLREAGLKRCYWVDLCTLARCLLRPNQQLVATKYFTARIAGARPSDPPERARELDETRRRQAVFLEALQTLPALEIFEGHYLGKDVRCRNCGAAWRTHEEKMTDVQIATQMLADAFADRLDVALLLSADSDLVPPTRMIRRLFPRKRIVVCFPPERRSVALLQAANAELTMPIVALERSQLPDTVAKPDGHVLHRPSTWR